MDNVTWECDYPHSDSTWPDVAREARQRRSVAMSDEEIDQGHPPQRHAPLPLRPVHTIPKAELHRRRPAPAGRRPRRVDPVRPTRRRVGKHEADDLVGRPARDPAERLRWTCASSPEQDQLVEAFAALYAKESPPERVRACEPEGFDPALWERVAELGVVPMAVGEADGGWGASFLDLALIAEQQGRAWRPCPVIEAQVAARLPGSVGPGAAVAGRGAGGRAAGHARPRALPHRAGRRWCRPAPSPTTWSCWSGTGCCWSRSTARAPRSRTWRRCRWPTSRIDGRRRCWPRAPRPSRPSTRPSTSGWRSPPPPSSASAPGASRSASSTSGSGRPGACRSAASRASPTAWPTSATAIDGARLLACEAAWAVGRAARAGCRAGGDGVRVRLRGGPRRHLSQPPLPRRATAS